MHRTVLLFLVGLAWWGNVGCGNHANKRAEAKRTTATQAVQNEPAPATQLAPQFATAADDAAVLNAVFTDLLSPGVKSPLSRRDKPPAEIRLANRPSTSPRKVDTVLMRKDKAQWDQLSPIELSAAGRAAFDLVGRQQAGEPFPSLQGLDPRVKIEPDVAPTPRLSRFDRPVHAYLPGYSPDRQYAVVALSLPWSIHHADATYLLAREAEGWRIVLRQFVYYV